MKVKEGINKKMSDLQLNDAKSSRKSPSTPQQNEGENTTTPSEFETNHPWLQHCAFGQPSPFYMGMFPHPYMFGGRSPQARHIDDGEYSDSETTEHEPNNPWTEPSTDEVQTDDVNQPEYPSCRGSWHGPPPFMRPHGMGPHGIGPHGMGPHEMGPHGIGISSLPPWMSMMPPPVFAMAMQRKMAKKWMKKMKKHSKRERKRNRGNEHMSSHDHMTDTADLDGSGELKIEGNIDPSCEPSSADSHNMAAANNSDDNASSSGEDDTWDFPPFMPPWMLIDHPWRMRKQGCIRGRHLHKRLQRMQFKHKHCAGGFYWGKHRCHKRWNNSNAQGVTKEPDTADPNNEEKQPTRPTVVSVDTE